MSEYKTLIANGLWRNNVVLAQNLALCPLLAVTSSATNGLGLGLATMAVMVFANLITSLIKNTVPASIRIPVNIFLIATLVTLADLILNAYLHSLHKVLGLFIPLIVTNCAILGRVESFATRQSVVPSIADAFAMGVGFTWVLVCIGGIREILGSGTLFANASLLLGPAFRFLEITVIPDYRGFLLAILPPGGFFVLSGILALQQSLKKYQSSKRQSVAAGGETCV